jgi:cellobiose phosphorylase
MPMLLMKTYDNTLIAETYSFVLKNQIRYGEKRNIPWGVSESGYYAFDISLNYQYKAFGVPELGLKSGMEKDIVVAPYATILALGINAKSAISNIKRLEVEGMMGLYGLYEAIDYTPGRLQKDEKSNIVKSFMAHHQGMSIVALNNYFNDNVMQTRFHTNPMIRSAELLLQERVPSRVTFNKEHKEFFVAQKKRAQGDGEVIRSFGIPDTQLPHAHILSNGTYSVIITNGGTGYSKVHDTAVSRWNSDLRGIRRGMFIFIQNLNSNNVWSAAYEPLKLEPKDYRVVFSPDKAEFIRKDGNIETHTEITVSPEENAEIRRVTLTNYSQHVRELELTSYFEVVLSHPDADIAHPAFSNLFIRTEYIEDYNCLIASRRPRSEKQRPMWAVHTLSVEGDVLGDIHYETDRFKFLGRNRDLSDPLVLDVNQPLSNTVGAVLDPIMSLRRRVRVEPGKSVKVNFVVAVSDSYKKALELADKFQDPMAANRAFELAWTRSQIEADYLGLKTSDVKTYLDMMSAIIFVSPQRRLWADIIANNKKGQPDLWPYGISGDVPVVLLSISSRDELERVYWLLRAHEFWRMKGLLIDLVILLRDESGYLQPLLDACRDAVASSHAREMLDKRGGVFIRNAKLMPEEDVNLLYTVARLVLEAEGEPAEGQLKLSAQENPLPDMIDKFVVKLEDEDNKYSEGLSLGKSLSELTFYNGLGGFTPDGTEYVINISGEKHTPAPWINVVSNPGFGFNVSESGAGFTWSENSRENKLTPWSNDPVVDPLGEVYYLRDEKRGEIWSITPQPIREKTPYIVRHGMGYTVFEHISHEIEQQLTMYCSMEQPVKIGLIKLKNLSEEDRSLSLIYYIRPVLGVNDQITAQYITTSRNTEPEVFLMENSYNSEFKGRIAFVGASEVPTSYTGDRDEFIGIKGDLKTPEALKRERLSGRLGAGYDPCVAIQLQIMLPQNGEKELVIFLGQGKDLKEAISIASRIAKLEEAKSELDTVKEFWKEKLGYIKVSTPDISMNMMLNGWLLYQTISCRIWSRSAFYQSGGAYGFRDQLQDVMAAAYAWPEIIRRQIMLHASHQFKEGDVQHWWHAETGKGIRTKYSDDLVWLAYVTADYIENTGDWDILNEEAGYLESEPLGEHEDERYEIPRLSDEKTTLYEHCLRALNRSLRFGEHGIPLMGCGDWNDGMNTVGNKGRGESVWLGWFIYATLKRFIPLCEKRGDIENFERFKSTADKIAEAIEKNAWDGSWYKRAYFDDGKPLGSSINSECQLDSISQSWAVISGAGKQARVNEAMNAVSTYLINAEDGLIKLLTPPFDRGDLEPGYIKGYVPGVRENGGQYTHAAIWVILAFAKMGMGDKSWQMFNLINPINHSRTAIEYNRYKAEPYVIAADVYAVPPHNGRGGWSWYTGAAGWMYRAGVEHILGLKKIGDSIVINPCVPREWKEFGISYRYGNSIYDIQVVNPTGISSGIRSVTLDDENVENYRIMLQNDGKNHVVKVIMGNQHK